MSEKNDGGESQARAQLASIVEMVTALNRANEEDDQEAREIADEAIQDDPLSVDVRSGWEPAGTTKFEAQEFRILLCTGGPAVQIVGEVGLHGDPCKPHIEYQDWFTPWTRLTGVSSEEEDALQTYCEQFYLGE
jgi:hypothetical protein